MKLTEAQKRALRMTSDAGGRFSDAQANAAVFMGHDRIWEALRQLERDGLAKRDAGAFVLTPAGRLASQEDNDG